MMMMMIWKAIEQKGVTIAKDHQIKLHNANNGFSKVIVNTMRFFFQRKVIGLSKTIDYMFVIYHLYNSIY
jgi:hypothetical protein